MAKGGVRVPEPVVLRKHVLVMSFIGCDCCEALFEIQNLLKGAEGRPAPKLKEAVERMSEKQMQDAYNQVFVFTNGKKKTLVMPFRFQFCLCRLWR